MIYQKDWLMRQIETMVLAIISFLLHKSTKSEDIEAEAKFSDTIDPDRRDAIIAFLQEGKICEAENWLYENIDEDDTAWLNAAVYFYNEINKLSDEYLIAHDFSREEIKDGLSEVCGLYGYGWLFPQN